MGSWAAALLLLELADGGLGGGCRVVFWGFRFVWDVESVG